MVRIPETGRASCWFMLLLPVAVQGLPARLWGQDKDTVPASLCPWGGDPVALLCLEVTLLGPLRSWHCPPGAAAGVLGWNQRVFQGLSRSRCLLRAAAAPASKYIPNKCYLDFREVIPKEAAAHFLCPLHAVACSHSVAPFPALHLVLCDSSRSPNFPQAAKTAVQLYAY